MRVVYNITRINGRITIRIASDEFRGVNSNKNLTKGEA